MGEFYQVGFRDVVVKLCVVRMYADASEYILVLLGNSDRLSQIVRVRIARPDIQHRDDARFRRALDNLIPIAVKGLSVNMAMGIDEGHFKRAPILTSSKKVAIAGVSSSVSDAAQIMP